MIRRTQRILFGTVLAVLVAGAAAADVGHGRFEELLDSYEAIRESLLNDTFDGVDALARATEGHAEAQLEHASAGEAGLSEEQGGEYVAALEEIKEEASAVAGTRDLSSAREAFFELTKPMVKLRNLVGDESTLVAYCPMARKAWMQADGDLGNPYLGREMPKCGEVVSD